MIASWHEFYVLLGTAAAALVALLFVAASIGAGILTGTRTGAVRTFLSPIVFHYTAVVYFCLIALIPSHTAMSLAVSIGIVAVIGLVYSSVILYRVHRDAVSDVADRLGYGTAPLVAYAASLAAAWLLAARSLAGPDILAGALLLLLVVNIRNAWDTTMTLVRRSAEQRGTRATDDVA